MKRRWRYCGSLAVTGMAMEAREVMTVEQVAEYLQATPEQVRRLIDERGLPVLRLADGELRIPRDLLKDWIVREASGNGRRDSEQRIMTDEEIRRAREETYARIERGEAPRLTQEFLDEMRAIRQAILDDRGGKPFPKGWIHEAIEEGRL